ncbi:Dihydrofolate synthase [Alteripontixanthobacter maritimus]|uniref:tetrahydrofolate synthase n=1 Tax=Alteripontixanthobacter maritimus TaxID=2161824 RepID=A0A369Q723_9SPHN|nr:bifunctional folylpolyglutamate synthase/dihydrofolate synthase [Alteripontixanthobacter maritimus]RDC60200.1 Dihydrofolate synthase [Alteripontixanthobacter maritimus]
MDFAVHADPRVQRQLDRLANLSLPQGRLSLDTIRALLERLDDPHLRLPPVFHVAGTNGKGSVCAFLRAMLEADGKRVHVTTSPHLVRYNERIRLSGELIADGTLAALLAEVLDVGEDLAPSFFEVTIAAAFTAFAREPADVCVVEVGLGGRFDATNVLPHPAACGVAALGIDHEQFLLAPEDGAPTDALSRIAFEKAGITKRGCPLVTLSYPEGPTLEIERAAMAAGAPLAMRGREWHTSADTLLYYADRHGELVLPRPAMPGAHQAENAALAVAMLRHQDFVSVSAAALAAGIRSANWPARLQRLSRSSLTGDREVWLDGGHNRSAGIALAQHFAGRRVHLVIGMLSSKDPAALIEPMQNSLLSITAVPVPHHDYHAHAAFGRTAASANDVADAIAKLPADGVPVLVAGSLYLAGEVLRLTGELPN